MYGLPVKVVILNNGYLGMVRQWQELFWDGRYAGSSFAAFQPSFAGIAQAYGIHAATVHDPGELDDALAEAFAADGPALVDVHVNQMAKVFPMVPSGKGPDAIIVGRPSAGRRPPSRTRRCARRSGSSRRRSPSPPRGSAAPWPAGSPRTRRPSVVWVL